MGQELKFGHYIEKTNELNELAYEGNLGFQELCLFYQKASPEQISVMENIIKKEDWLAFKSLIKKILKIELK
jgi:hypothetical protein